MSHYPEYIAFKESLQQIQDTIDLAKNQSYNDTGLNQTALFAGLEQVQQLFKEQILTMNWDRVPSDRVSSMQSYVTEMHKQMRLLATDAIFFQTARQPATQQQRLSQITTRIETLIRYCDALLE